MKTTVTFSIDTDNLSSFTDSYLAALWHISQANIAPFGDQNACELAEKVGREIIRRFVTAQPPELWVHQGRHVLMEQRIKEREQRQPHDAGQATTTGPAL